MSLELIRRLAASQSWLDVLSDALQAPISAVLARSPSIRNTLDGRWLGTPLHPVLISVPLGAWVTAFALDLIDSDTDGRHPGDGPLTIGILAAFPAALTGVSDWAHLKGESRRIGSLHAVLNSAGLGLNIASLACRLGGRRSIGRLLSFSALGVIGLAAHAGGQLSFGLGTRVNRTAWPREEAEAWTDVLAESDLGPGELVGIEVAGVPILVARSGSGDVCAIHGTCSHLGAPLAEGTRDGDTVTCPWHGSTFDLRTGQVLEAPAVFPQPRYETRVRNGRLELRAMDGASTGGEA